MKKILPLIFALLLVLSACQEVLESNTETKNNSLSASLLATSINKAAGSEAVTVDTSASNKIDADSISRMLIIDTSTELETEYSDPHLMKEFCSFLEKQKYTGIEKVSGNAYSVELFDRSGKTILTAAFKAHTQTGFPLSGIARGASQPGNREDLFEYPVFYNLH